MDSWFLFFTKEKLPPVLIGDLDMHRLRMYADSSNFTINSISMGCENCLEKNHFEILEVSSKNKLFFIPLGKSDFYYIVKCKTCGSMVLKMKRKAYLQLKEMNLMIEKK